MDTITVDIEATNRCNADCHFCPRDATPHQGLMSMETFEKALERAVELRDDNHEIVGFDLGLNVNICGLGEPLINKHTPTFIAEVRAAGFDQCGMATNGALLNEKRATAILEAGVTNINVNIADLGDDYEDVYHLPYEKTRDNIARFIEMAGDDCDTRIVLVNYKEDPDHTARMKEFWRDKGARTFVEYDVINRGGALFVDHMQYEQYTERRAAEEMMRASGTDWLCAAPYLYVFVGYDGLYYLCCSDWTKEAPMASVFDASMLAVSEAKLRHLTSREPVCKTCNHDPLNAMTDKLRALGEGDCTQADVDALAKLFTDQSRTVSGAVANAIAHTDQVHPVRIDSDGKRRIPVVAL